MQGWDLQILGSVDLQLHNKARQNIRGENRHGLKHVPGSSEELRDGIVKASQKHDQSQHEPQNLKASKMV